MATGERRELNWRDKFKHWRDGTAPMDADCPRKTAGPFKWDAAVWRSDGTCSHCGSLNADAFMEAVRAGCEIGPTDKSYKVYVNDGPDVKAPQVSGMCKFYFQHLTEENSHEFIELLNKKKINIGAPGHFYVLPYFIGIPTTNVAS